MSLDGQRVDPARYSLVPRTLSFVIQGNRVLLMKLGNDRAGWAGLYNGLGGHIERGEDPQSAADRELREESGLELTSQRLCGVVAVDTGGSPGIGLYVFVGELGEGGQPRADAALEWLPLDQLEEAPLVEDLSSLLPAAIEAFRSGSVFSAAYRYGPNGELQISFAK